MAGSNKYIYVCEEFILTWDFKKRSLMMDLDDKKFKLGDIEFFDELVQSYSEPHKKCKNSRQHFIIEELKKRGIKKGDLEYSLVEAHYEFDVDFRVFSEEINNYKGNNL